MNIPGLSSFTVYSHYQDLREKGTSNRKIDLEIKVYWVLIKKVYSKANKEWWNFNSRGNLRNS